jgi:hypothetical protein
MRALRRSDFDWWIVLDDVDDPADLVGLWPGGARGRTLWLTRRRGRDMGGEGRHVVVVEASRGARGSATYEAASALQSKPVRWSATLSTRWMG